MNNTSIQSTLDNLVYSIDRIIDFNTKELEAKQQLIDNPELLKNMYPHVLDPEFNIKIANKREFNQFVHDVDYSIPVKEKEDACNDQFELSPNQIFVKHFLSSNTPYNGLLLYHGLGTGKTCSAISICEEHRKYMNQMQITKRILIVASPNVQDNFRLQLFDERKLKRENNQWNLENCVGNQLLKEINPNQVYNISKKKIVNYIKRIIDTNYKFIGYAGLAKWVEKIKKRFKNEEEQNAAIKQTFSNRMMVIDEIHNIRVTSDNKGKKVTGMAVQKIVDECENIKLLLLSATPMFNSYEEIIFILNLLNRNDNRDPVKASSIFTKEGEFIEDDRGNQVGKELFIRKSQGYISFVKGEHLYTFPYRIYPLLFDKDRSVLSLEQDDYPSSQIDDQIIMEKIEYTDIYLSELGDYQQEQHAYIMQSLVDSLPDRNNSESLLELKILDRGIQSLNMIYPIMDENNNSAIGKEGLLQIMDESNYVYKYKEEVKERYGRIFQYDKIGNYSGKIHSIIDCVKRSKGIVLIYSQYIEGGCIPLALALEELGLKRYGRTANVLEDAKSIPSLNVETMEPIKEGEKNVSIAKYIMITGNVKLSPDNETELKAVTNDSNVYGNDVKVVVISRAASEGVDFKYIRQVHIMDPWYNNNRNEQIIGRAVRYCSHKALPLEQRNVQIFMHGTKPFDSYEPVDLYIYRNAEYKSKKIGYISRVMKETAVDCILNSSLHAESIDSVDQNIEIELSTKDNQNTPKYMHYDLGSRHYSNICDYQDCNYTCTPDVRVLGDDVSTYQPEHMILETIIHKIKMAFKEKYIYEKEELLGFVRHRKTYSIHQIHAALDHLIKQKDSEFITDANGTVGYLKNVGNYYMFQPATYGDSLIAYDDRIRVPDFKYKIIQYNPSKENKKTMKKAKIKMLKDNQKQSIIHHIQDLLETTKKIQNVQESDDKKKWYATISNWIDHILDIPRQDILKYILGHILDHLLFDEKKELVEYIYSKSDVDYDPLERDIFQILERTNHIKNDNVDAFLFYSKNKDKVYELDNGKLIESPSIRASDAFRQYLASYIYKKEKYNDVIGFTDEMKNRMEFKLKYIERPRNKGFRCDQAKIDVIRDILNTTTNNTFKTNKKISRMECCCILEIVLRHYNHIQKDDRVWYLHQEIGKLNNIYDVYRKKKEN